MAELLELTGILKVVVNTGTPKRFPLALAGRLR
jgi:hypothetical protein